MFAAITTTWAVVIMMAIILGSVAAGVGRVTVEGVVYDQDSGEPIGHVTVQAVGTGTATKANVEGKYRLVLDPGAYEIKISHVGYYSQQVAVNAIDSVIIQDVRLKPSIIDMGAHKVYTRAYDPAQRIIAEAIARKKDILSQIHDYSFDAYSRLVVSNAGKPDSEKIMLITESRSTSYWEYPDKYKEVITARTQSANLPAEANLVGVGEMLNFNKNRIDLGRYEVVSPTARDAMDHYNYYLLDTVFIDSKPIFVLEVEPKNEYAPLFVGEIQIADSTFDVVKVDVGFSKGIELGMIDSARYYQSMAPINDRFWLPVEVGLSGRVTFGVPLPGVPKKIDFAHVASIYQYRIDVGHIPGTFNEYRIEVADSADDRDSSLWASLRMVPLTERESRGYERIDSVKHAPKPFYKYALQGVALGAYLLTIGNPDVFHFNRVEGPYAGIGYNPDRLIPNTRLRLKTGYSFDNELWQYEYGISYCLWPGRKLWLGASIKDEITHRPTIVSQATYNATSSALIFKIDPFDYYREKGFAAWLTVRPINHTRFRLEYRDYRQLSQVKNTDYGWLRESITPRDNPPIINGTMRSVSATISYDSRMLISDKGREFVGGEARYLLCEAGLEYASPDMIADDFDFRRYHIQALARTSLLGLGMSTFFGYAGSSDGDLPPQRYFIVDFHNPDYSQPVGFKTVKETNFGGDRAAALYAIHDFGPYVFRATGDGFLRKIPLGLAVYGGAMWVDFARAPTFHDISIVSTVKPYSEIGFELNNLTPFLAPFNLALDFSWQLSHYRTNEFSLSFDLRL